MYLARFKYKSHSKFTDLPITYIKDDNEMKNSIIIIITVYNQEMIQKANDSDKENGVQWTVSHKISNI